MKHMKTQLDWDNFYLNIAKLTAQQSYASDRKVGAIIVKDDNIISFSYNGTLRGTHNDTCDQHGRTFATTLHAELQAIAKVARSTQSTEGSTMYCTTSPCIECAKAIVSAGIARVVYDTTWKYTEGIDFMKKAGILVNEPYSTTRLVNESWVNCHTGLK